MASITNSRYGKTFGEVQALSGVNLEIEKGEFFTLLGPSGCGKTTLLRTIAGFYHQDKGDIYIDGELINNVPAYQRNTGMVFQNYAVFPHMTVFDNVAYGLRVRKLPKEEISRKVSAALKSVHLEGYERRHTRQALGRPAAARRTRPRHGHPAARFAFDEPLSNLDAKLRIEMREEIRAVQKSSWHHFDLCHTRPGRGPRHLRPHRGHAAGVIQQIGKPWEIYRNPQNTFWPILSVKSTCSPCASMKAPNKVCAVQHSVIFPSLFPLKGTEGMHEVIAASVLKTYRSGEGRQPE
jgi:iron(III) transport system ATP-binding protein